MGQLLPGWYTLAGGDRLYWTGEIWVNSAGERMPVTQQAVVTPQAQVPAAALGDNYKPSHPRPQSNGRSKWKVLAVGGIVLTSAALIGAFLFIQGLTPKPSLSSGWDYGIDQSIGHRSDDYEFDYLTGKLEIESSPKLSQGDEDVTLSLEELRAEENLLACRYILTEEGDLESYQVRQLLQNTHFASMGTKLMASDKLRKANSAISETVTASLPTQPKYTDREYGPWQQAYDAAFEKQFPLDFPELVNERKAHQERLAAFRAGIYNEDMVVQAQKFLVKRCDVNVPNGYTFKTSAELGIELD